MCHFPAAYILDSVPPKNSNLYWHYGVTFGDSHNIFHNLDKTSVFIICNYYPGLYQQLNIRDFFEEIYVSDSVRALVLKKNNVATSDLILRVTSSGKSMNAKAILSGND